jgi:sugar phosphate permease
MTAATGGGASGTPTRRTKGARIAAGTTAGAASLVLTLLLTATPERLGLSTVPELFERVRAEDRASDAFIFAWALITIPVAGLLHTPLALARRARIGAGWALIAS